jgi:hypothetical protein
LINKLNHHANLIIKPIQWIRLRWRKFYCFVFAALLTQTKSKKNTNY